MIRINKSGVKQYYVTVIARNGEILSTSEVLNSKAAVWKNIAAQTTVFDTDYIRVIDIEDKRTKEYNFKKDSRTAIKIKK